MKLPIGLAILVALLCGPFAVGGDVGGGGKTPAKGVKEAKSSPEAASLLEKAIAHQGAEKFSKPGSVQDLTVKIEGDVWDYTVKPPRKNSLQVRRYLETEPLRFRSEWATSVDTQVYGFDGKRYWYADYDRHGKLTEARFLLGDKYASDRQRIHDEIAETRYLLRFFFLANLEGPHVVLHMEPDRTVDVFGKHDCKVIERENLDPKSNEPPLTLCFDAKTLDLVAATAHATKKGQRSLLFHFRYDERVQPRVNGVLFPFKMETLEQRYGAQAPRILNRATVEENGIAFNTGIPKSVFLRPK